MSLLVISKGLNYMCMTGLLSYCHVVPLVHYLLTDVFGWPKPSCSFPSWVSRYSWRDLSGRHTYLTNTEGSVISVRYKYANNLRLVRAAYRCLSVAEERQAPTRFLAMSFSSEDWWVQNIGPYLLLLPISWPNWYEIIVRYHFTKLQEFDVYVLYIANGCHVLKGCLHPFNFFWKEWLYDRGSQSFKQLNSCSSNAISLWQGLVAMTCNAHLYRGRSKRIPISCRLITG